MRNWTVFGLLTASLALSACGSNGAHDDGSEAPRDDGYAESDGGGAVSASTAGSDGWFSEVALTAPAKLGGCAVGELDPDSPGNEIVAVSITGEVFLVRRSGGEWTHEVVARATGELIQCAIGDVDPRSPGNEIVGVGMREGTEDDGGPGAVFVVRRTDEGWRAEHVFTDEALVHGVCAADLVAGRSGDEILAVGFSKRATLIHYDGRRYRSEVVARLEGAGKAAVGFDGGAAVVTSAGNIVHVVDDGGWLARVLDTADAGQSRIGTDGTRLLAARDDGGLGLWADGTRTDIYSEGAKLRGAVIADIDPDVPGLEAATAGYELRLSVLYPEDGGWRPRELFMDTGKFHHVAAGELLEYGRGTELVTCGYSQRLVVHGKR